MKFNPLMALIGKPAQMTRFKRVQVTSAQVLTLRATPKVLVPAQGAGRLVQLVGGVVEINPGATAYTETAANLVVRYTNTTGVVVSQVVEMTGFITQTVRTVTSIQPAVDGIVVTSAALNRALVLHNNGAGEFANAGTGTLTIWLAYRVWNLA